MTREEFERAYPEFIDSFNQAFDTQENRESIMNQVIRSMPDDDQLEQQLAFEMRFSELRQNNLIKAVVSNFLLSD